MPRVHAVDLEVIVTFWTSRREALGITWQSDAYYPLSFNCIEKAKNSERI
jgi:hypothetical protein